MFNTLFAKIYYKGNHKKEIFAKETFFYFFRDNKNESVNVKVLKEKVLY